ncbi:hypothetical protein ILT44_23250 [Microvirga sp. BT689]|uniref:AbiJ-NTD4 domain-containing protein n=1 Tax=Microvirga arvi TaxID=2778731 RepID=UPI001951C4CF|nr:hypothetical protein [Microvirga arvi]MBM6583122.1 hypothetical protein [Microvirga arvi]
MRFSERYGHKPVRAVLQVDSMDSDLRTSLWNVLHSWFLPKKEGRLREHVIFYGVVLNLQLNFFKRRIDAIPEWQGRYVESLQKWFFSCEWFEVYDFMEFMRTVRKNDDWRPGRTAYDMSLSFGDAINSVLEREESSYRFVGEQLTKIIDEAEIDSLEQALQSNDRFSGAREHMRAALQLYSNRKDPDYRNSIKEAISAIESAACVIAEDPKATLGQALKVAGKSHDIHPAMSKAFEQLYGYTSDSGGIRHAMLEEKNIDEHEARFMLIACSAFLNYLTSLSKN